MFWTQTRRSPRHGDGSPDEETYVVVADGAVAAGVGRQGGDGPQDGPEVSPAREASQRLADRSRLADAGRPVYRGLAVGGRAVVAEPGGGGKDAVGGVAAGPPRSVCRRPVADAAASGEALAGSGRSGQGGVLRPG